MEVKKCEKEKKPNLGHDKTFNKIATLLHIKNYLCQIEK